MVPGLGFAGPSLAENSRTPHARSWRFPMLERENAWIRSSLLEWLACNGLRQRYGRNRNQIVGSVAACRSPCALERSPARSIRYRRLSLSEASRFQLRLHTEAEPEVLIRNVSEEYGGRSINDEQVSIGRVVQIPRLYGVLFFVTEISWPIDRRCRQQWPARTIAD
eukprot:scaffold2048_cov224-Pinguiococcus_pyrenoidosus.AAC.9